MNIDIRLIRHVLALAQQRNFARAAEQLNLSQPALSRSIAGFEQVLGVALFDRTREGVFPTDYGRIIIERGQDILRLGQELQREIDLMQGLVIGELSIVAGPFPHALSVGPALSRLLASGSGLRVRMAHASPRATVEKILEGLADLAIADLCEWNEDVRLQCDPLPPHRGFWVARAGHPLAGRSGIALAEVLAHPVICAELPRQLAGIFGAFPQAGHIDEETGLFYPAVSLEALVLGGGIAAASDAIMLTPISIVAQQLERGELSILDLHLPWQKTAYGFVSKHGRTPSTAALEFMNCVRDVEEEIVAQEHRLIDRYLGAGVA
jgi:DNA-binding transcriptional LysR family regulator